MPKQNGGKALIKNGILSVILLTGAWAALNERGSVFIIAAGAAAGVFAVYFCRKYLPFDTSTGFSALRFAFYPFFLVGQIYLSGFAAIRLIMTDAETEIVTFETKITDRFMRVILANSITLTPGTVSLDLSGGMLTVLRLVKKNAPDAKDAQKDIGGGLEKMLLKIQKQRTGET